jgi:hypothetical protein
MSSKNLVLFYSNKCVHSKEFLSLLHKDTNLNNQTTKVNVDNPNIKLPPYVKSVPSLIVNENNKPNLLVGSKIFDWYNKKHKQNISSDSIMDWDPQTMSGYSDGFSYLESEDVMKKSYSFISDSESINTPDESNYESNSSKSGQVKSQLDNDYESFMSSRTNDVAAPIQRLS